MRHQSSVSLWETEERLSCHEDPLKSDKLYEEPQAIYPMEMEQE
jgi:hypothetical protein